MNSKDLPFEGRRRALDREDVVGCGLATASARNWTHPYLAKWLDIEVLSLRLMDERFYHLDTCFCPLNGGYLLYYPQAFVSPTA